MTTIFWVVMIAALLVLVVWFAVLVAFMRCSDDPPLP